MTRFARAKGSKASNEKAPEDGTPWEVMKEQLLKAKNDSVEAKKQQEAENQRIQNYENFLKEQKVLKRKATWCDFPEEETRPVSDVSGQKDASAIKKNKKKNKQKATAANQSETLEDAPPSAVPVKSKKNKSKNKGNVVQALHKQEAQQVVSKTEADNMQHSDQTSTVIKKKKKKNKPKKPNAAPDNLESNQEKSKQTGVHENGKQESGVQENGYPKQNLNEKKSKEKKNKKDGVPVRRKVINDRSFQLIINGKEVELVRFDGFPVMKKDAERLQELKTSMMKKGIPKSEVQRTLKLERRRAEKALGRLKRDVCYNCRKGGHNLSDCPDLKSKIPGADTAEGICFKCGSTEHRQFECKVQRNTEFRFATCFICKESGHIARQCPDNPKGLYPNGGCCKLCGDVTHLRKDCPTVNDKKEETSIKLQTLDGAESIEDVGQQSKRTITEDGSKKPKKIRF